MKVEEIENGALVIVDKPLKLQSSEVTVFVKELFEAKKAGHTGTLDPNVTGVLPILLNKATKLSRFYAMCNKTYVGIVRFRKKISEEKVKEIFASLTGEIVQVPPKESAVAKRPRKRKVYYIKFLEMEGKDVLFETKVQHGTYIRVLCQQMGKGVGGAKMIALRRIKVGRMGEEIAIRLDWLEDLMYLYKSKGDKRIEEYIHEPWGFLEFPKVWIKEIEKEHIRNGLPIRLCDIERRESFLRSQYVQIFCKDEFLGIGKVGKEKIFIERLY